MLEKWGQVPSPFFNHIRPFHFEQGQSGPERIWSLTSVFPLWSMLKKWGQAPNPFEIILVLFILKGAMLVLNGFGIWPLPFHFGVWTLFTRTHRPGSHQIGYHKNYNYSIHWADNSGCNSLNCISMTTNGNYLPLMAIRLPLIAIRSPLMAIRRKHVSWGRRKHDPGK